MIGAGYQADSLLKPVLQLDRNYASHKIISWRKAVDLVIGRGKAEVLEDYPNTFFAPAVIRITSWSPSPYGPHSLGTKFKKSFIKRRDKSFCQYCGKHCKGADVTIDHITPKIQGGKNSYENCVLACFSCNSYKGGRTPEQAGMRLLSKPSKPQFKLELEENSIPCEWKKFVEYL